MSEPRHIDSDFAALMREELVYLWADLHAAKVRAMAADGWSVEAEGVRDRIEDFTRIVGAVRWQAVQLDLLEDYEHLHAEWGVPFEPVDWDHVERLKARRQRSVTDGR